MRSHIESFAGEYNWYKVRREEYQTDDKLPFRVSPRPLELDARQSSEIHRIGRNVADFMRATDELFRRDETVHNLLNTGKPEIFLIDRPSQYLFVRPDLILTKDGFRICEIETSPFGLGLAELINRSYNAGGVETMVESDTLTNYVQETTPNAGSIIYSPKTSSYAGQLEFLSDRVFAREWKTQTTGEAATADNFPSTIYRGFYLAESMKNSDVAKILERASRDTATIPSLTPHLEEKAVLTLLWDKRFEAFFRKQLGDAAFQHLRTITPETWIVGQEKYFAPGLPNNYSSSVDLANLSRSKRTFVVKPSGFTNDSSWSEGVQLLHEKSAATAAAILRGAAEDHSALHVIQAFHKAIDIPTTYEDGEEETPMLARFRVTPYYSFDESGGTPAGKLLTIKATGCENTDFIHGSTASINTAVATARKGVR